MERYPPEKENTDALTFKKAASLLQAKSHHSAPTLYPDAWSLQALEHTLGSTCASVICMSTLDDS